MNTLAKEIAKAKKDLEKVEKQLEKHRATCGDIHGNGTMRKARASRNWDYYAQEKNRLRQRIEELELLEVEDGTRKELHCVACGAMFEMECVCSENDET